MDLVLGLAAAWFLTRNTKAAVVTSQAVGTALLARATQVRAREWAPILERAGASKELAAGLSRWIGLESSGNPLARSQLGERGLLQIMETTAKAALTPKEWAALANSHTTPEEHARIALKQFGWHAKRALGPMWASRPVVDQLWWAKAHHAYPKDLTLSKERPSALIAAKFVGAQPLDASRQKRLAAANLVAWSSITPP